MIPFKCMTVSITALVDYPVLFNKVTTKTHSVDSLSDGKRNPYLRVTPDHKFIFLICILSRRRLDNIRYHFDSTKKYMMMSRL